MSFELEVKKIPLGNDYDIHVFIEEKSGISRWRGSPSLVPQGFISLSNTASAAEIGSLIVTLTEDPDVPGSYSGTVAGSLITSDLASYVGQTVYEVVKIGSQLIAYRELIVSATNEAD